MMMMMMITLIPDRRAVHAAKYLTDDADVNVGVRSGVESFSGDAVDKVVSHLNAPIITGFHLFVARLLGCRRGQPLRFNRCLDRCNAVKVGLVSRVRDADGRSRHAVCGKGHCLDGRLRQRRVEGESSKVDPGTLKPRTSWVVAGGTAKCGVVTGISRTVVVVAELCLEAEAHRLTELQATNVFISKI